MLKYIILGYLTHGQFTGYDLKQMMTYGTSNFMSAGFGGIYPALKQLEKAGYITSVHLIENGRNKKIYSINESGIQEFMRWLEEPINFMRSYEDVLGKVFFYEKLPKETAVKLLNELIKDIGVKVEDLEDLKTLAIQNADQFQLSTLDFGIDHLKFMIHWYETFVKKIIS